MRVAEASTSAIMVFVVALLIAGCGEAGVAESPGRSTPAAGETSAVYEAVHPTGSAARTVAYRCRSGREGTLVLEVADLRNLADAVNGTMPCEYDDGVAVASFTVRCESGPVVVRLATVGGRVERSATDTPCPE
jgi:hypothetical protein